MKRAFLVFFFMLLLSGTVFAVIESASMKVFAVTDSGNALSADLIVELRPGSGKVWSSVEPLIGTSTQTTEKLAKDIARRYSTEVDSYDFYFDINSNASLVDGPSAGAAMALLVITMLQGKKVPKDVAITGTITADGGIGAVGGVFEKSKEAARSGIKLFMIPAGEAKQTVKLSNGVQSVNLVDYASSNWGLKVVEVNNIDEVLQYAFTDIESIDVNTGKIILPDFIPKPITYKPNLGSMRAITASYVARAEEGVKGARNVLSGMLLNEPSLVEMLLQYLNEAEKYLSSSRILLDQNYLYSSANNAFLAIVYSGFVRDVADNPELLSTASTFFENENKKLEYKIDNLMLDLNKFMSVDRFEWNVAAQQRLGWAKLNVEKISKQQIIITIGGDAIDEERVRGIIDFEFAKAWYSAAEDFAELSDESTKRVLPDNALLEKVDNYIANSEKSLVSLTRDEAEDPKRRIESAKMLRDLGWVYPALFDSASALALINASIFVKNKDFNVLQVELEHRILVLEEKMSKAGHDFVWAQLYLDHAKYYLSASHFYQQQGQLAAAAENASSGMRLVFLADAIFDATESSYTHFESLPASKFLYVTPNSNQLPAGLQALLFSLGAVIGLVSALAVVIFFRKKTVLSAKGIDIRLRDLIRCKKALEKKKELGSISDEKFRQLSEELQEKIDRLVAERRELSKIFVELDISRSKLFAFERTLRELKKQFKAGEITEEDYKKNIDFYNRWIDVLKCEIEKELLELKSEKEKVKTVLRKKPAKKKPKGGKKSKK